MGEVFYPKVTEEDTELPRSAYDDAKGVSLIECLSLLTPFDIDLTKQRIGPQRDGGYVLIPELFDGQPVLSYGIGGEYHFEIEMARRGHPIYMFDHTITKIEVPDQQLRLTWIKQGVAGGTNKEQRLDTIENQLQEHVPFGSNLILKMDVEGDEYEAFDALPQECLQRFEQIVFEIHNLHSLSDSVFRGRYLRILKKLNRDFTLFHVHANNFDGGIPIASSLAFRFLIFWNYPTSVRTW